jgi:ribosomal protein S18 acetylase RimI-like enzyme
MDEQRVRTELVRSLSAEVTEALEVLLPQLSAAPPKDVAAQLGPVLASDASRLLVAREESGRIVGALTLVMFAIPSGRRAWIEDVVVDRAARGRGVGASLILEAVARATAEGVKSIDLTSRPSRTNANRPYERLGFVLRDSNVYRYGGDTRSA